MDIITEAKDAVQAINEITEWKVATTNSVKILGDLISRLVDRLEWRPISENTPDDVEILIKYIEPSDDEINYYYAVVQSAGLNSIGQPYYDTPYAISSIKVTQEDIIGWLPLPPLGEK